MDSKTTHLDTRTLAALRDMDYEDLKVLWTGLDAFVAAQDIFGGPVADRQRLLVREMKNMVNIRSHSEALQ